METKNWPKTFEEACVITGDDPKTVLPWEGHALTEEQENTRSFHKAKIITRAIRGDWKPDWNNWDQPKWFPVFDMRTKDGSGFGFSFSVCVFTRSNAGAGSRLCFETKEQSDYAGTQFIDNFSKLQN